MVPALFLAFHERLADRRDPEALARRRKDAARESAAVVGFTSAVAAYGAFFVPRAFGASMKATGSPAAAIVGFVVVYVSCILITWWFYARRGAELPS